MRHPKNFLGNAKERVESTAPVESRQLCVAADMAAADEDLRNRQPASGTPYHFADERPIGADVMLGKRDTLRFEEPLGEKARTAQVAGIDLDLRH
jgi:hypothetical protein